MSHSHSVGPQQRAEAATCSGDLRTYGLHRMSTSTANADERLLWRTNTFEFPLAYGGCTLRPVADVAIFWPTG